MRKEKLKSHYVFEDLKEIFLDDSYTSKGKSKKNIFCKRWSEWENLHYVNALKIF